LLREFDDALDARSTKIDFVPNKQKPERFGSGFAI